MRPHDIYPISKELIPLLKFPSSDVLFNNYDKEKRLRDAMRGMTLGNTEHVKVCIVFSDEMSYKVVETTIWSLTDKHLILKSNIYLPINRILLVKQIN